MLQCSCNTCIWRGRIPVGIYIYVIRSEANFLLSFNVSCSLKGQNRTRNVKVNKDPRKQFCNGIKKVAGRMEYYDVFIY